VRGDGEAPRPRPRQAACISSAAARIAAEIERRQAWAQSPLGRVFARYERLVGRAWCIDAKSKSLRNVEDAWLKADAARAELVAAMKQAQGWEA
jgi:hypothetical protein